MPEGYPTPTSRVAFIALAVAAVLCCSARADAHPLGNFTINHLTKVRVDARAHALTLRYVLDIAEIPTFQIMRERDIASPADALALAAWARTETDLVEQGLAVEADGHKLDLQAGVATAATRPGAGGLPILYWVDDFRAALPATGLTQRVTINDGVYAGRIGWKDVVVVPDTEPTRELKAYPTASLSSPRDVTGVAITIAASGDLLSHETLSSNAAANGATSQIRSNKLSDMLARGASNPWLVLLTFLTAIALGALHALEPGHGKTLLAVSLVGSRATPRQALVLALALTFAHTAGVLALGLLMLAAAQWIVPENVYPWITLGSGMLVAGLGASALARFVKARRGENHAHGHSHHGHAHVPAGSAPLSFRSVVLVAMSGNIAPCPAALVVLLTALTLHQLGYGLLVIVAFSAGLALVLTGLGIALVRGATWLSKRPSLDRATRYAPIVSGGVIALIGAFMLGRGAAESALHAPALLVTLLALAAIAGYALSPGHSHEHAHDGLDGREGSTALVSVTLKGI